MRSRRAMFTPACGADRTAVAAAVHPPPGDGAADAPPKRAVSCSDRVADYAPDVPPGFFGFDAFNHVQRCCVAPLLLSDSSVVVAAPTGSGKTVLLELALLRLLQPKLRDPAAEVRTKAVYVTPMKALAQEKVADWRRRFTAHGIQVSELTGDSGADLSGDLADELAGAHVIVTTPEKWDSVTRRRRESAVFSFVGQVRLLLIDEVHTLSEDRGPVLEATVSRMKATCQQNVRFVGVSATLPNAEDLAEWFRITDPEGIQVFGEECRPVPLQIRVLGFDGPTRNPILFDRSLTGKVPQLVREHSDQRAVLVFCHTRASTVATALTLSRTVPCGAAAQAAASRVSDRRLSESLGAGVAFHHAGLSPGDRETSERAFRSGAVRVMCATSTLALGVNLPAHLVIVKGTQTYSHGGFQEMQRSMLMQMCGRAGRPGLDTHGKAVVLTRVQQQQQVEALLTGRCATVESRLHHHLVEHINAEIALGTVGYMEQLLQWLQTTFFWIRVRRNPVAYGYSAAIAPDALSRELLSLLGNIVDALADAACVTRTAAGALTPTRIGREMAKYYVSFSAVKHFRQVVRRGMDLGAVLGAVSGADRDFEDCRIRQGEKKLLNELNKKVRFAQADDKGKKRVATQAHKVAVLVQCAVGDALVDHDPALRNDQHQAMRTLPRVARCFVELATDAEISSAVVNGLTLMRCASHRMWEVEKLQTRQLPGVGPTIAQSLARAGLTSLTDLAAANAQMVEGVTGRQPPFGSELVMKARRVARYQLAVSCDHGARRFYVTAHAVHEQHKHSECFCSVVAGDGDDRLLLRRRFKSCAREYTADGPIPTSASKIVVVVLNEKWLGCDDVVCVDVQQQPAVQPPVPPEHTPHVNGQLPPPHAVHRPQWEPQMHGQADKRPQHWPQQLQPTQMQMQPALQAQGHVAQMQMQAAQNAQMQSARMHGQMQLQPAQMQPAQMQPAQMQPAQMQPAQATHLQTQPPQNAQMQSARMHGQMQLQPAQMQPAQMQPAQTAQMQPAQTAHLQTQPPQNAQVQSARMHAQMQPAQVRMQPAQVQHAQMQPAQIPKVQPAQMQPSQMQPAQMQQTQMQPAQTRMQPPQMRPAQATGSQVTRMQVDQHAQVQPIQVQPAPMQPAPMQPAPMQPAPMQPAQSARTQMLPAQQQAVAQTAAALNSGPQTHAVPQQLAGGWLRQGPQQRPRPHPPPDSAAACEAVSPVHAHRPRRGQDGPKQEAVQGPVGQGALQEQAPEQQQSGQQQLQQLPSERSPPQQPPPPPRTPPQQTGRQVLSEPQPPVAAAQQSVPVADSAFGGGHPPPALRQLSAPARPDETETASEAPRTPPAVGLWQGDTTADTCTPDARRFEAAAPVVCDVGAGPGLTQPTNDRDARIDAMLEAAVRRVSQPAAAGQGSEHPARPAKVWRQQFPPRSKPTERDRSYSSFLETLAESAEAGPAQPTAPSAAPGRSALRELGHLSLLRNLVGSMPKVQAIGVADRTEQHRPRPRRPLGVVRAAPAEPRGGVVAPPFPKLDPPPRRPADALTDEVEQLTQRVRSGDLSSAEYLTRLRSAVAASSPPGSDKKRPRRERMDSAEIGWCPAEAAPAAAPAWPSPEPATPIIRPVTPARVDRRMESLLSAF
eukprot:TRINITY_DN12114_c0_g1_i3.p1 TRINITY_DN12114_c0_g1~~TRINITY_DN12114_c0_g1_i3.p1  ORF type:complete len:1628 (+),score=500.65 TRINITY_DN12114_c0_g1_i3:35-4918(+)